jgi:hypothetical protein
MMTVSRRDGHAANSMQKVGCVMDANTPIIAAAQSAAVPTGSLRRAQCPLIAGSSPQRRGSRDKSESAAMDERDRRACKD